MCQINTLKSSLEANSPTIFWRKRPAVYENYGIQGKDAAQSSTLSNKVSQFRVVVRYLLIAIMGTRRRLRQRLASGTVGTPKTRLLLRAAG